MFLFCFIQVIVISVVKCFVGYLVSETLKFLEKFAICLRSVFIQIQMDLYVKHVS